EGEDFRRMGALAGCRSAPVMRIERVGEEGIAAGLALDALREHVRAQVAAARTNGFVGLKTIAAYRSGLDVASSADPDGAARALAGATRPARLEDRALLELLLHDGLEANEASGAPLPLQVHCGFGDA